MCVSNTCFISRHHRFIFSGTDIFFALSVYHMRTQTMKYDPVDFHEISYPQTVLGALLKI